MVVDGRATYSEVGAEVGLSAPAVKRRVDRLVADGTITGFTAVVDPDAGGPSTEAFVELFCRGRTSPNDILAAVRRLPEVIAAYTVSGEADAIVHLRTPGMAELEACLEAIRSARMVERTTSVVVLSRLMERRATFPPPPSS